MNIKHIVRIVELGSIEFGFNYEVQRVLAKGHRIFGHKSMQLERWSPKVQHFNKRMHTKAVWVSKDCRVFVAFFRVMGV